MPSEDVDEATARQRLCQLSGVPAFWAASDALVLRDAARRRAKRVCEELTQKHLTASLLILQDQENIKTKTVRLFLDVRFFRF